MILHANAIPQNRSARIGTGGIDCDNPHRTILFAIVLGQLIDQRTLARARRPSQAQNPRVPSVREQRFQQLCPAWRAVLDHADSPRQTPRIAGAQLLNQWLEIGGQPVSVKQTRHKQKRQAAVGSGAIAWRRAGF